MSTKFEAELALSSIEEHPKNPRHKAVADDDMVASVREHGILEPAIVAPHPTKPTKYTLIAGHRRRDAAKKAKLKSIPALIREDLTTDGQQIEAMIIENGHREDLTPIEEAEGYAQLELLGYKPSQIAAAVGRNVNTVRTRLKLLKLSESTRKRLHAGQLTIEHAIAIGEFTEPDIVQRLEKAAANGGNLEYEISNARQLVERRKRNAETIAALLDAGATEYKLPKGKSLWQTSVKQLYSRPGDATFDDMVKEHAGCLRFLHESNGMWPSVVILCETPQKHQGSEGPDSAWKVEQEKLRVQREQRAAEERSARDARVATALRLLDSAKVTLSAPVRDLFRVLLPQTLVRNEPCDVIKVYQAALGVHEDDRWSDDWWSEDAADATRFVQHVEDVAAWSDAQLVRALVCVLLGDAEYQVDGVDAAGPGYAMTRPLVRSYFQLLAEAGHKTTPIDEEIIGRLDAAEDDVDDEDEAKAEAS